METGSQEVVVVGELGRGDQNWDGSCSVKTWQNNSAENNLHFSKREDERVNTVASGRTRAETQVHTRRLGHLQDCSCSPKVGSPAYCRSKQGYTLGKGGKTEITEKNKAVGMTHGGEISVMPEGNLFKFGTNVQIDLWFINRLDFGGSHSAFTMTTFLSNQIKVNLTSSLTIIQYHRNKWRDCNSGWVRCWHMNTGCPQMCFMTTFPDQKMQNIPVKFLTGNQLKTLKLNKYYCPGLSVAT